MINFEEELEKYEPSLDIEQVSEVVNNSNNMTDVTDIMRELIAEVKVRCKSGRKTMKCPRCDTIITEDAPVCRFCGQDLRALHHARKLSNAYYNIGLEKAKVRDLSGAILVLKKSLNFNKHNTEARNLLGLVYNEMGETIAALSEWVLSDYLQPKDNRAKYYIDVVQKNQSTLQTVNQTIKKYNSALKEAKNDNEDLAIIQLKRQSV